MSERKKIWDAMEEKCVSAGLKFTGPPVSMAWFQVFSKWATVRFEFCGVDHIDRLRSRILVDSLVRMAAIGVAVDAQLNLFPEKPR